MWKQITRGVRESLDRFTIFRTKKDVINKPETQIQTVGNPCRLRFLPCVVESFFRKQPVLYQKQNAGIGEPNQTKDEHREKCHTSESFEEQYSFIGAMGWSGALILGYILSQRLLCKASWCSEFKTEKIQNYHKLKVLHLLPQIAQTQPINDSILSTINASISTPQDTIPKQISADQAFEEAVEELRMVHEKVIGESENRKGVACLSQNSNQEAIEHFLRASHYNNAPAAFNLGQCYELGIGTKQDFKKAAEWYQLASDRGHPTAMYNLGVFYAHGWGGLKANVSRARHLFEQAARLGQADAQAAVDRDPARRNMVEPAIAYKQDKLTLLSALEQAINYHYNTVWNVREN